MKLSTRGRYAFRMMMELAQAGDGETVRLREIAHRQQISVRYLQQLALKLKKAGLVSSTRGARGGFALGRPAEKITLFDIFQASEGGPEIIDCISDETICARGPTCPGRELWRELSCLMADFLRGRTLADMVMRPPGKTAGQPANHPKR